MRTITTTTGVGIALDGDLLAIIETLFQEVTVKHELDRSYEDMMREIRQLISQMSAGELRDYLAESLFHNTVRFENERLAAYMARIEAGAKKAEGPSTRSPRLRSGQAARSGQAGGSGSKAGGGGRKAVAKRPVSGARTKK